MIINRYNSAEICRIAEHCSGIATRLSLDDMSHPRGILAHIVNFFNNGCVIRDNVKQYNAFAQQMTKALVEHKNAGISPPNGLPERLVVKYLGYTVLFSLPGENHNAAGPVTIEVSKGREKAEAAVDSKMFGLISTALLFRHENGLTITSVVLTDNNRMDLQGVNLRDANLVGANLRNADLSGADLKGANLSKADLSGSKLNEADLSNADLSGANLRIADLSWSKLIEANLSNADLNWANLFKADLSRSKLIEANLSNADLGRSKLNEANLSNADLRRTGLSGASLDYASLNQTNLTGAMLRMASLRGADLNGANLSKADLSGSKLIEANLSNANLNGANLAGADLSNIRQDEALLQLPLWSESTLDTYLDHINNPTSGSLLTMMDSIDARHADVKLLMARKLMTSLQNAEADLTAKAMPLMDILSKAPYTGDTGINAWLGTLCEQYLSQYNERLLPENEGVFNQSVDLYTRLPERMLSHNGTFIQVIAHGMAGKSKPEMKAKAEELYVTYLRDTRISLYCNIEDFGDGEGKPDWSDEHANNFILIPAQSAPSAQVSAMLLSQASLEGMLRPKPDTKWYNFYLYKDLECLSSAETPKLNELFIHYFPFFSASYTQAHKKAKFLRLLEALNLGSLHAAFVSATDARYSQTKLINAKDIKTLREIFTPKLVYSIEAGRNSLEDVHYGEIISAYDLASASDADKGKILLCLAALFAKYSSSAIFGTERESPQPLRDYAYALMERAHSLNANLVNKEMFAEWTDRLLGLNDAFSCSAVLSDRMFSHIRLLFSKELDSIMPPSWN